nr:hypothetical protein [Tanacetum cinerariifolium]
MFRVLNFQSYPSGIISCHFPLAHAVYKREAIQTNDIPGIPTYGERIDRLISEIGNHYAGIKRMTNENRAAGILDNHAEGEKPVSAPPATPAVAPAKPLSFIANLYLQI